MTAVKWIISKLPMVNDNDPYLAELIDQANEMFEQQIIDAYWEGCSNWDNDKDAEQYYNETFNK